MSGPLLAAARALARSEEEAEAIAENIRSLSAATGVPIEQYVTAWLTQPAPGDMDPDYWRSALRTRALKGRPWPEKKLRELSDFVAGAADPGRSSAA
jgi:hypothetical protein